MKILNEDYVGKVPNIQKIEDIFSKYVNKRGTVNSVPFVRNEGKIEFTIDDLRDYQPITWYLEYRQGIKYKKCEKCGKRFEVKSNNKGRCNECQKEENKKNKLKYYKKIKSLEK